MTNNRLQNEIRKDFFHVVSRQIEKDWKDCERKERNHFNVSMKLEKSHERLSRKIKRAYEGTKG